MDKEAIKQRFKKVNDSLDALSNQQQKEIEDKVAGIRDTAVKKLSGIL